MGAVVEAPLWIALNGERRIVLSCSPHEPAPLALGHLIAEGWIERIGDLYEWHAVDGGMQCSMDDARIAHVDALRRHQVEHGCGLRHFLDCDPLALPPVSPAAVPDDVTSLLRSLFAASGERGVHAAGFSDGKGLLHCTTDVARHCAVDRIIGMAVLGDAPGGGLVLTSRVSGAIALKAARAGLGWIASRSIATSLAQEICAAAGVALYERAGRA